MSTKMGLAPRRTTALAVETNVYDGRMTSSEGPKSHRIAAISRAEVQDVVSSTRWAPKLRSSIFSARLVNGPLPLAWPPEIAWLTYSSSEPTMEGLLNGIVIFIIRLQSKSGDEVG